MDEWEAEFPVITSLGNPENRLELLAKVEKLFRRITFWMVMGVIIYLVYLHQSRIAFNNDFSRISSLNFGNDPTLIMWQLLRNKLLALMFVDIVLMFPLGLYYAKKGNDAKVAKLFYNWIMLTIFITFSFALAGLAIDIINIGIATNYIVLKNYK